MKGNQLWPHPKSIYFGNDAIVELYPTQITQIYGLRFPPFKILWDIICLAKLRSWFCIFNYCTLSNDHIDIHFISLLNPIWLLSWGSPNCQPHIAKLPTPCHQCYIANLSSLLNYPKCFEMLEVAQYCLKCFFWGAKSCPKK